MPNSIAYATLFQTALDEKITAQLASGALEANASMVKYNGGSTVKIPKVSTSGLGTYSKTTGFPAGSVTLEWEEKTLTQDRGREFTIDAMDNDESAFVDSASNVLGTFQKDHVVPEVDAYRFSKIYSSAVAGGKAAGSYTPAKSSIYSTLSDEIADIRDKVGDNVKLMVYMSGIAYKALKDSSEFEKKIDVANFDNGIIKTQVRAIDDVPIFRVPSDRFKTAYTFGDDGYAAAAGALQMNWIILADNAAIAIVKTDKIRIFDPATNQDADGWKIQMRKYHDLWLLDNKLDTISISATPSA